MTYQFTIGFDARNYGTLEIEAESMDAAKQALTRDFIANHIQCGNCIITGSDFDLPLNISAIDATKGDGEVEVIGIDFSDTVESTGQLRLSLSEIRELVEAVESGTAYNSEVYAMLRKQLADADNA